MKLVKLALFSSLCTLTHGLEYPDELFDRVEVEAVMESSSSNHLENLGLHFNVPNAFNELNSFLSIQESIQTGTKAHSSISPVDIGRVDFKDEPPILCETICTSHLLLEGETAVTTTCLKTERCGSAHVLIRLADKRYS